MNITHHIEVIDNATPVCKVSNGLEPKLGKELKPMVDLDIIKPIKKSTYWVYGLVILKKKSGVTICLDLDD